MDEIVREGGNKAIWTRDKVKQKRLPLRTLLVVTYVLQIVAVFSIFLSDLYAPLEMVRQITFIILLTFIPGTFLLGFFRIREVDLTMAVVIIVGLSIFFIFACGLVLMLMGLITGTSGVITGSNLFLIFLCSLNIIILLFLFLDCPTVAYTRRKLVNWSDPFVYLAILIPVVAVLGAIIANEYQNTTVEYITLFLIIATIIYAGLSRARDDRAYPWLLYGVALGLLFHTSFISSSIWGWDIHKEYYIARTVIENATWNYDFYSNINAMMSIVVLVPTYSLICDLDLTTVFKLICPMLFAFAPLALFSFIARYSSRWFAFISLAFAVSFYAFFQEFPQLGRQEIGMVFFVLVVSLLLDTNIKMGGKAKIALTLIFGFSLVISHYGTTYLLLLVWMATLAVYLGRSILQKFAKVLSRRPMHVYKKLERPLILNIGILLTIGFITILWYTSVTNASAFKSITNIVTGIIDSLLSDPFDTSSNQGLNIIARATSTPLHSVGKVIQMGAQGLIGLGILSLFFKKSKYHFPPAYTNLAISALMVLIGCIVLPNFASALNTSRIITVMLVVLAPMSIAGIYFLLDMWKAFTSFITKKKVEKTSPAWTTALSVLFVIVFLLFNTGLIYQVESEQHTSFALDGSIDYPRYNDREIIGTKWLISEKVYYAYADAYRGPIFNEYFFHGIESYDDFLNPTKKVTEKGNLIYLGTYNVDSSTMRDNRYPADYHYYDMFRNSTVYNNLQCIVQYT